MNIELLFPTPVSVFELDRELTDFELKFLLSQNTLPNVGNLTSQNSYLLEDRQMRDLKQFLQACLEEYAYDCWRIPKETTGVRITQSWVNYAHKGQFHHTHHHPNSIFSGVFYIEADEKDDTISFHKPPTDFSHKYTSYNTWNSDTWWLSAKRGRLFIFPSTLFHSVKNMERDGKRISLSFNSFYTGVVNGDGHLTELRL